MKNIAVSALKRGALTAIFFKQYYRYWRADIGRAKGKHHHGLARGFGAREEREHQLARRLRTRKEIGARILGARGEHQAHGWRADFGRARRGSPGCWRAALGRAREVGARIWCARVGSRIWGARTYEFSKKSDERRKCPCARRWCAQMLRSHSTRANIGIIYMCLISVSNCILLEDKIRFCVIVLTSWKAHHFLVLYATNMKCKCKMMSSRTRRSSSRNL